MEKLSFLTVLSSRFNRRKLLTRAAPLGIAGTALGTLASPTHAQGEPTVPLSHTQVQPEAAKVPLIQVTNFSVNSRSARSSNDIPYASTHTFNNLGGKTVLATTALTHVSTGGTSHAWAYFSEYSDASGSHPISGQVTTWLIIPGATSVTLKVEALNAYAQSITTLWFYQ